ncbi:hypothetical protein Hanom_Chr01g00076141 [Helianthus anomalus]
MEEWWLHLFVCFHFHKGVFLRFVRFPPEFVYRHYCLVEMDMTGWFCWWHNDTPVVRQ